MSHPAITTWLLAAAAWAALLGVAYLCRPLYRQRPSVAAIQPGSADVVDVAEFIDDTPAFESSYAVGPAVTAGDEQ